MSDRRVSVGAVFVVIAGLAAAHGGGSDLRRFEYVEPHMGTRVRIVLYAADEAAAKRASGAAFQRIAELNGVMSDYLATSELMQFCAKAGDGPVPVGRDLYAILARSQEVSQATDGAFDVTVGPVVRLWRLSRRTQRMPPADRLAAARALVDYRNVSLDADARSATLAVAGMQLDLGGIAKGYAADAAQAVLREHGVTSAMVAVSGDIVVSAPPPGQRGWSIGIGGAGETANAAPVLELRDTGISTSGDEFQYVTIDGKRYAHIVDPRTGLGLVDAWQVTVVARDGTTADALATALTVMGPERGLPVVERMAGVSGRFVRSTGRGVDERTSARFPKATERGTGR